MNIEPTIPTIKNPPEQFAGDVWVDMIAFPHDPDQRTTVARVRFAPGGRTAWHSHAGGQTLYVTEGRGCVQSRGEAVVELRPGDVHRTPDGQDHWHGAVADHLMSHISITHGPARWGAHRSTIQLR